MRKNQKQFVLSIVLTALFAALSAALSQVQFPINAVPIVFTQVAIFLAAGLLGWKWGALSQALFVAMGAIGLPVFAGFSGGISVVVGPTGGFIWGYVLAALAVGLLLDKFGRSVKVVLPALILGTLLIYLPGVPWLMYMAGITTLKGALLAGVLPYLPGDAVKIVLCTLLIPRLHPIVGRWRGSVT